VNPDSYVCAGKANGEHGVEFVSEVPGFSSAAGSVTSVDGTIIGYRDLGSGPGVILLHGAGQSSVNFKTLAEDLSAEFTVYVPDRRGRGLSGPHGSNFGLAKEVEDLKAILRETRASNVFGLSAGAVIALETARTSSQILKLALYEPPLQFDGVTQTAWLPQYERDLNAGDYAAALVAVLKGTADRSFLKYVPRFALVKLIGTAMKRADKHRLPGEASELFDLIPTVHFDAITVQEATGSLDRFATLSCEVLLLGGTRSARELTAALNGLNAVLPNAQRVVLKGVGHTAADNGGKPHLVSAELRSFFS
jgi:pimeloyl-ACP methyl ester carboxylesterase